MNQTEAGMDFPRRCLQSCGAEQRPLSPGKKNQNTNAELNVCGVLQWTLKISPIHEIAQLKMRLRCSIAAPAVSSACWFYVVDVGRLFFFCMFVCLPFSSRGKIALTHIPRSIVYETQSLHPISLATSNIRPRLPLKFNLRLR